MYHYGILLMFNLKEICDLQQKENKREDKTNFHFFTFHSELPYWFK